MSRLDDIKRKVKVEALVGLFVLVLVVGAGGIFFLGGSATNDTQVATVVPPALPQDNGTQDNPEQGSIVDEIRNGGYYYAVPGGSYNPGGDDQSYIPLDPFEVPPKGDDKEDSGIITPVDQHDDDEDDLWDYPEAPEEDLDPDDITLPGDDGFPDDLFPEEDLDNETDDETPGNDVEIPDDIGDVEDVDPTEDEDEFPEETPGDMPDDDWIDDWING